MNPYLSLALVIGAFFLGRSRGSADKKPLPSPVDPLALPPPPEELDALWSQVQYEFEFYPADDGTVAPPGEQGIRANPDCSLIVLGVGWWRVVEDYAVKAGSQNPTKVFNKIMSMYLPRCVQANTPGASGFRNELKERLAAMWATESGLGPEADIQPYTKPGTSLKYTIALVQKGGAGWTWRVWAPGPVTEGTEILSGSQANYNLARLRARAAVNNLAAPMIVTMNPRRNGHAKMLREVPRRQLMAPRLR